MYTLGDIPRCHAGLKQFTKRIATEENREYVNSVPYIKHIYRGWDNLLALSGKLSFHSTGLDIFDIRQCYVRILFICHRMICRVLLFLTPTNMKLAAYGNGLAFIDVMNHSTGLDIFDIRQCYVRILFICHRMICRVLLFLTPTNMKLAAYGNGLAFIDVMNHVDCVIKSDVYPLKMHSCSKNIRGIIFFLLF